MCQDIEHGGGRCPSDTSEARRHRRKASTILTSRTTGTVTPPSPEITAPASLSTSMSNLKNMAESLKEKAYGEVPEGETQASWDSKIEKQITSLGIALGEEADTLAGFNKDALTKRLRADEEKFYGPQNKISKELEKQHDEYFEKWDEIAVKYAFKSGRFGYINVKDLTDEQKALLDDEEKKTVEKFIALSKIQRIEQAKFEGIDKAFSEHKEKVYSEANQKLSAAYIEVISQIRPLGGVNIDSNEETSNTEAQKIIADTVGKNYPTAWLEHHNAADTSNLKIVIDNVRPHYNAAVLSETEDDGLSKNLKTIGALKVGTLDIAQRLQKAFTTNEDSNVVIIQHKNWENEPTYSLYVITDADERYNEDTHGPLIDGKPEGEEWVYRTSVAQVEAVAAQGFTEDEDMVSFLEKKAWVRPRISTKKELKELSIYSQEAGEKITEVKGTHNDMAAATAYHEFGHRMEEVLPNNVLPRQEKAFLARRTGKTNDNWHENMVETGMAGEYGHDAGLVIKYAGREYFSEKNYEVFTVGVEALYGGNYGGLVGNTKEYLNSDNDHRGFVLGVLASL